MKNILFRCQSCGSSNLTNQKEGLAKCNHCGSMMLFPKNDEEILSLLSTAFIYRESYNYDLAIKTYQYILEKYPNELSAYEGILLSEYGIEYVKDSYTGKLIPTCHRAHFESILKNDYYKTLLALANETQKQEIETRAKEIDNLQASIEKQLKLEESFDIFISYKSIDNNGEKTEDSVIAHEIYDELTRKNYKVFFAEKTLENRLGSEYEPIIYKALHTSKIFILVGTSKENIESAWVRNEWSRFIDRIKTDETLHNASFIPVFKNMNPYDMPKVNNQYIQGIDATKIGYSLTLVDGIQRILKPQQQTDVINVFDNTENLEQFEKIRNKKIKEIKNSKWNDLQSNPNKKNKKFFYNFFLLSPLIALLPVIILMFDFRTWIAMSPRFIIGLVFLIISAILATVALCIQKHKFIINIFKNIILPYGTILLLIIIFPIVSYCIPIAIDGSTASNFSNAQKYKQGTMFSQYYNQIYISGFINNNYTKNNYYKTIDGKTWFVVPNELDSIKVYSVNFNSIPKNIDVLVIPKYSESVYIPEISNLKEIYIYSANTHIQIECKNVEEIESLKIYFTIYDESLLDYSHTPSFFLRNEDSGTNELIETINKCMQKSCPFYE